VFGASGGVGQLVCQQSIAQGLKVQAVTRNIASASVFAPLAGCTFVEADARDPSTLMQALQGMDAVVISIGTTAFPTSKWEDGKNNPQIACVDTVRNILDALDEMSSNAKDKGKGKKGAGTCKRVVLLSSIGVDRAKDFPFVILNLYGVLSAKKESETLLLERSLASNGRYEAVVVRPGRLVGAPFTNFDLAKLLGKTNEGTASRGVVLSKNDDLAGDCERGDVALAVTKILKSERLRKPQTVFSIINEVGATPNDDEWDEKFASVDV
jgi:nucleoside-diphosphate-sugar epimerase